jgi:hypothetical protein
VLWHDGHISCDTVADHKAGKRASPIIKAMNKVTGKESTRATDFNLANWGTATSSYIRSIKKALSTDTKFEAIINDTRSYAKVNQRGDMAIISSTIPEEDFDVRAQLCDDESDDE